MIFSFFGLLFHASLDGYSYSLFSGFVLIKKLLFEWKSRLNQENLEKLINFFCLFVYLIDEREISYNEKSDIWDERKITFLTRKNIFNKLEY